MGWDSYLGLGRRRLTGLVDVRLLCLRYSWLRGSAVRCQVFCRRMASGGAVAWSMARRWTVESRPIALASPDEAVPESWRSAGLLSGKLECSRE